MDWHALSEEECLKSLASNRQKGLTLKEARNRLQAHGKNSLVDKKKKNIVKMFLSQFSDFMVIVLLIAAAISYFTSRVEGNKDYIDSIIILAIVIVNAITGVIQESKAEHAINALKKLSSPEARVLRGGQELHIPSDEVVPGDILLLECGDFVPADARILEAHSLKTEESALTGESQPVEKSYGTILRTDTPIAERRNMLFGTSSISAGHAVAVAVETGMNTQVGKIAHMINESDTPKTPLQNRLAQTGKLLGIGALVICLFIFVIGLIQNTNPLEMFMISISLAVAAIPEGLPAVVTIVLALGVRRMAINRAIIRHLPAVETLGSAQVICSDKTGTLTQNKMTVVELMTPDGKTAISSTAGARLLSLASLCNNSTLAGSQGQWTTQGDPTETALLLAAAKSGMIKTQLDQSYPRVNEIPFDSARKLMTTVHTLGAGRYRIITKGAPDVLLPLCSGVQTGSGEMQMTNSRKASLASMNENMASRALRVLAVAYKDVTYEPKDISSIEKDLVFCGLIGMIDPPRPQAKDAVRLCKKAGIKPVMITGDHIATARAIAKELGILNEGDKALTGAELDKISQDDLTHSIWSYSVFARVSPEHKVRIVKAFQERGAVVAMTGDGVNDAPALKMADIGCAMGMSGTDVAKGAADMILTDDNFATIVSAVREGRGIYDNIKKTVHFLISCNIGEILTVFMAFMTHLPTPLLAIQLLWVNLVTDSLPALALGVDPIEPDVMDRKPVNPKDSLFSGGMGYNIAVEGCLIGMLALLAFTIGRVFFDLPGQQPVIGRTMCFAVLSLSQLVHAFNVRSPRSLFKVGFFSNPKLIYATIVCVLLQVSVIAVPSLAVLFKTSPLTIPQWLIVALFSFTPLFVVELEKYLTRFIKPKEKKSKGGFKAIKKGG